MRISFLIAIFLSYGLAIECPAQKADMLPGSDYKSIVRFGETDVTAPSRFGASILVSCSINGSPVELALDTGASYSLIAAPLAKELKLKRAKGRYVGCSADEYAEARIQIGKITVENQRLCPTLRYGMDSNVAGSAVRVQALLGYDFLRNFVVEVDYGHGIVVLHKPATFKHRRDEGYMGEVPFRLVNGTPHIDLTMVFRDESRRKIDALVDTGSWLPLMLTAPILEVVNKRSPDHWEFGREWPLGRLGFQDYDSNKSNLAGPINFDAVLGLPFLARYKVIFDYSHNQLIVSESLNR
ncbi:MAG: hypothetical protein JWM21_4160 [Acidobacteria bacterium]|nr:hypothetical protein [Acidobacteriota bacterium]